MGESEDTTGVARVMEEGDETRMQEGLYFIFLPSSLAQGRTVRDSGLLNVGEKSSHGCPWGKKTIFGGTIHNNGGWVDTRPVVSGKVS